MARRRYITSEMSDDRELNAIAALDDFAALLYTWAIPHAGDDRSLPGEPDDLLFLVCPRRRDKSPEDVEQAVVAWVKAGLCDWVWVGKKRHVYLKAESFYRIQAYIPADRRIHSLPEEARPVLADEAETASNQPAAEVAQTSANRQSAAESAASLSPSVSAEGSLLQEQSNGAPTSAQGASTRRRRTPSQPVRRIDPAAPEETRIIAELQDIAGWPGDDRKDLEMVRAIGEAHPDVDLLAVARKFRIGKLDKPFDRKSNPRSQFRTWVEHERAYGLRAAQPRARNPDAGWLDTDERRREVGLA